MIKHILGFFEDLKAWWVTPITASDIKAKLTPAPKEKPDYGDVLRPNPMNREPNLLDLHDEMMENARKTYFGDAFEQRATSRFGYEMAVAEHERLRIEMHIRDINEALKDTEDEDKFEKVAGDDCPECEGSLILRTNSLTGAKFLGCNNFPECHFSKSVESDLADVFEDVDDDGFLGGDHAGDFF